MDFDETLKVSTAGMSAQTTRLRTIAENLANADSTALTPGADPYRRKLVTFRNVLDETTGNKLVKANKVVEDASPFEMKYMPGHPAADGNGYVRFPNVNTMIEMADMKDAQRAYTANVDVIDNAKTMLSRAISLLQN
ncbi:MAG TPA: flagellar basal body rod protein FlgC [Aliidongia sp.]|nr:flagellar basal body rod protein FlgC [Aliidongia sp.]